MKRTVILVLAFMLALALAGCGTDQAEQQRTQKAQVGACQDNLRTIDSATMQYAAANNGSYPRTVGQLVPMYLKEAPTCPVNDAAYTLTSGTPPRAVCPNGHTY